ncbi:amastin-like surface protein, putative [Leishmania panamensis]|uniref:Amastin-like surface protein, putative n=1 Tax=Leishmania panamensis TaxID=5679 RepID=A0AC62A5W7_LEIPA
MKWRGCVVGYAILQAVAFLLVLMATPIDMYRFRPHLVTPNATVTTLWGVKKGSLNTTNVIPTYILWRRCPARLYRFRLAQAFAVISILIYGAATVLGLIMLYCCHWLRVVCVVLNGVGALTVCIVWGVIAMTYHTYEGPDCWQECVFSTYGTGFIFLLLAWILDLLNMVFLLLPLTIAVGPEDENREEECKEYVGVYSGEMLNESLRGSSNGVYKQNTLPEDSSRR